MIYILYDFEQINVKINSLQMKQWSTLRHWVNYVQYKRSVVDYYRLDVKATEHECHNRMYRLEDGDREVIDLEFSNTPQKLKGEYFWMHMKVLNQKYCIQSFMEIQI